MDTEDYGDDSTRLREYAEKKYDELDGSQTRKMDPNFEGDAN